MTAFELLFVLLVIQMAGVVYAIQVGVAHNHRRIAALTLMTSGLVMGYLLVTQTTRNNFEISSFSLPQPKAATVDPAASPGPSMASSAGGPAAEPELPPAPAAPPPPAAAKSAAPALAPAPTSPAAAESASASPSYPTGKAGPSKKQAELSYAPFTDCDKCPSMIRVPAGRFFMGSPDNEQGHQPEEGPQLEVTLGRPFAASRFPVTRDEFHAFVTAANYKYSRQCLEEGVLRSGSYLNPGLEQSGKHPAVCVSWRDANAYVEWLRTTTGKPYRLLSEAEFEYIARAKTATPYPTGNTVPASLYNVSHQRDGTIPVGYTGNNIYGVCDVFGNAWTWTQDCWTPDMALKAKDGSAINLLGDCSRHAIRGGAWDSNHLQIRSAARAFAGEGTASNTIGFRVARDSE